MLFTAQILPIIYVENKTKVDIENIYFTYEGCRTDDARIKKIKSGGRDTVCIYSKGYSGAKSLIMYNYGKNNIKYKYNVCDKLGFDYISSLKIQLLNINEDGSIEIEIEKKHD